MRKILFLCAALVAVLAACESPAGPSVKPGGGDPAVPAAPEAPVLEAGEDGIAISWAKVPGATAYEVWYHTDDIPEDALQLGGSVPAPPLSLTEADADLSPGAEYFVWVLAKNAAGASAWSPPGYCIVPWPPRHVGSAEDLAKIGNDPGWPRAGTYVLDADLTLDNWTPLAPDPAKAFRGKFDGGGRTITLTGFDQSFVNAANKYVGLFGYVKGATPRVRAEIKDLVITSSVNAASTSPNGQAVGLIAGCAENAEISGITLGGTFGYAANRITYAGGIAGYLRGGAVITDCGGDMDMTVAPGNGNQMEGSMYGYSYTGGFAGLLDGGGISRCRNTGDVFAHSETAGSQVFVGGVAGGTFHGFSTAFHGYIEDSSSTGKVWGKAKGDWTFAGGIAGTMVGGGGADKSNPSRILRCWAKGTVTVEGTGSGYPYVGGIVGYNYYGALVSRCFFDGDVAADSKNDYTGGVAGYNSRADGHSSRIEDCYSKGTVRGFDNAGGIAGNNQLFAFVRRCYTTSAVSTSNGTAGPYGGAGGIVGRNGVWNGGADGIGGGAIEKCVALNPSVTVPAGNNIGRVAYRAGYQAAFADNRAWSDMTVTTGGTYTPGKGANNPDGADCEERPPQSLYAGLGWNFASLWRWDAAADLPRLGLAGEE